MIRVFITIKSLLLLCLIGLLSSLSAATYTWVGDGTNAGVVVVDEIPELVPGRDNDWNNVNNWLVNGDTPDEPPGVGDTVVITFQRSSVLADAVLVPNGAQAGKVEISQAIGSRVRFGVNPGDSMVFEQLLMQTNTGNAPGWYLTAGTSLELTGNGTNTGANPTWRMGRGGSDKDVVESGATLSLSGSHVRVNSGVHSGGGQLRPYLETGSLHFTNPTGTVELSLQTFRYYGSSPGAQIGFRSGQTLTGGLVLLYLEGRLIELGETPGRLDNMGHIMLSMNENNIRNATSFINAGTYRAIDMTDNQVYFFNSNISGITSSNSSPLMNLEGDVTLVGHFTSLPGAGSLDYALYVGRERAGTSGTPELNLQGHNLTISSQAITRIGGTLFQGRLSAEDSEVSVAGLFWVGAGGQVRGNEDTLIRLFANMENESIQNTLFDLATSTVRFEGEGTAMAPQYLDIHGVDMGATTDGMIDNFAFGRLEIGTAGNPTFVELIDLHDFSGNGSDALYLGELYVAEGSVLFTNSLPVYVNGTEIVAGEGIYGPGLVVIPEPAVVSALAGGLLLIGTLLLRRRLRN